MSFLNAVVCPSNASFQIPAPPHRWPYESSSLSSASSSVSSVFSFDSLPSSQESAPSTSSSVDVSCEPPSCSVESQYLAAAAAPSALELNTNHCAPVNGIDNNNNIINDACPSAAAQLPVPPELRQNPRRTRNAPTNGPPRQPPPLVRQCERKWNFVDSLVDSAAQIVECVWPLSAVPPQNDSSGTGAVLPLRVFIQETLRRSRTSYSTLQVALYYLILVKSRVPKCDFTMEQPRDTACSRAMQCGRRMFLAALILASKYLQDRNYSSRAWSKISGLSTAEINQNEFAFLDAVDWRLHIAEPVFQRWTEIVLKYTPKPGDSSNGEGLCWSSVVPSLTPDLDVAGAKPQQPPSTGSPARDLFLAPSPSHTPVPDHHRLSEMDVGVSREQTPMDDACYNNNNINDNDTNNDDLPKTLEPNPRMDDPGVPLPPIPKLGLLPTPQMTPQSNATNTPAAGAGGGGFDLSKSSIGTALCRANAMSIQRSAVDQCPPPPSTNVRKQSSFESYPQGRRSSLARSASSSSSSSSPDSMISDAPSLVSSQSSRSSRSSSISSHSSGSACAAVQARLASRLGRRPCPKRQGNMLKECRKNLSIASPIEEGNRDSGELCSSPEQLSAAASAGPHPGVPDLSNFSLGPPDNVPSTTASAQEAAEGLCALSGTASSGHPTSHPSSAFCKQQFTKSRALCPTASRHCRKRGRTFSEDTTLQDNVRQLMGTKRGQKNCDGKSGATTSAVLPDRQAADSFLLPTAPVGVQCGSSYSAMKLPRQPYPGSMKRACCGKEEANFMFALHAGAPPREPLTDG